MTEWLLVFTPKGSPNRTYTLFKENHVFTSELCDNPIIFPTREAAMEHGWKFKDKIIAEGYRHLWEFFAIDRVGYDEMVLSNQVARVVTRSAE